MKKKHSYPLKLRMENTDFGDTILTAIYVFNEEGLLVAIYDFEEASYYNSLPSIDFEIEMMKFQN